MTIPKFETKQAMLNYFRDILHRHDIGVTIPEPDASALHWLVSLHPEAKQKIGVGIVRFFKQHNLPYGTCSFHLERADGTTTDFSYLTCVNGPPSAMAEVERAMRAEVAETGKPLSIEEAHADHINPLSFNVLMRCFLATHGIDPHIDMIVTTTDNLCGRQLADREIARRWINFHRKLAEIRLVDSRVNTSDAAKSKIKKGQLRLSRSQP
jgi:hypothetical protein